MKIRGRFFTAIVILSSFIACKDNVVKATKSQNIAPKKIYPSTGSVEFKDEELKTLIDENAIIEVLAKGFEWSEGPLWLPEIQKLIFSDVPMNTIYSWSEKDSIQIYLQPSGYTGKVERGGEMGSNGLTLSPGGKLVLAQHGNRSIGMMNSSLFDPKSNFVSLAAEFEGKRFNSPNDVVFTKDGTMFFTDPPYGLEKGDKDPSKELEHNGIYRKTINNPVLSVDQGVTRPNGIAFSPDEKIMYVACSDPNVAVWYEYTLGFNLNAVKKEIFANVTNLVGKEKGLPDGLKVKSSGHIFATGPGGVLVFNPDGRHLGTIRTGEATSNCAFDDKEGYLYITADAYLMRIALKTSEN